MSAGTVPSRKRASAPSPWRTGRPRLLPDDQAGPSLAAHLARYGVLPDRRPKALVEAVERSGLRGRGGAAFPTGRKLRAVIESRGRAIVVVNATEGEPASGKDAVLLRKSPHLVIDGAIAAARAVDADAIKLVVSRAAEPGRLSLAKALAERSDVRGVTLHAAPERFITGEETALVHWLNGGDAKPTISPPRPSQRGVGRRPTLVQNAETIANIGLIARYGSDWLRLLGTREEPGSVLLTISGAVARPGVLEVPIGTLLGRALESCGGADRPAGFLIGGYFGAWLDTSDPLTVPLSNAGLRAAGTSLGAGIVVVFPEQTCGLRETARAARYLANESAGQCGPCMFGLPAIADAFDLLVDGHAVDAQVARLGKLTGLVQGRGACAHPDGAARLALSALRVFADEIRLHGEGRCRALHGTPLLSVPPIPAEWR